MKKIFIFALLFSATASASGVKLTKIKEVLVGPLFGNNVFVTLTVIPSDSPECHTNGGYSYVFDGTTPVGKSTLSVVLAAYAANKDVKIGGTGECTLYTGVENLRYIGSK